jgi:hypothetical protein
MQNAWPAHKVNEVSDILPPCIYVIFYCIVLVKLYVHLCQINLVEVEAEAMGLTWIQAIFIHTLGSHN